MRQVMIGGANSLCPQWIWLENEEWWDIPEYDPDPKIIIEINLVPAR